MTLSCFSLAQLLDRNRKPFQPLPQLGGLAFGQVQLELKSLPRTGYSESGGLGALDGSLMEASVAKKTTVLAWPECRVFLPPFPVRLFFNDGNAVPL